MTPAPGGLAGAIFAAVNQDRAASGLPALGWSGQLAGFAQSGADQCAAAGSPQHQSLSTIMSETGMSGAGENLFGGPGSSTAATVEAEWMGSSVHRTNILHERFTIVAVGTSVDSQGRLWVAAVFAG